MKNVCETVTISEYKIPVVSECIFMPSTNYSVVPSEQKVDETVPGNKSYFINYKIINKLCIF